MELAGYIASLFIGISLGLIGGGGSILSVPVLVYLFSLSPTIAISYSLFIVGFTSLVGAFNNFRRRLIDFKTVLTFGVPSAIVVYLTRTFLIPILPDVFFRIGAFQVTHSLFVMVVFALLMLAASVSMIQNKEPASTTEKEAPLKMLMYGVFVGLVTGFLGAGGGFLLIPALVILVKLPMKKAIGTSLLIIAANSIIGFAGDIGRHAINWKLLLMITGIAITGVLIGTYFNKKTDSRRLKSAFGWLVLTMGIYIIFREIFFKTP